MPEGKIIEFAPGEYPQLDGLEVGSQVKFSGTGTIDDAGLLVTSMEFQTEGAADREFKQMRKQSGLKSNDSPAYDATGDDF